MSKQERDHQNRKDKHVLGRRSTYGLIAVVLIVGSLLISYAALRIYFYSPVQPNSESDTYPPKAAIVDQLNSSRPNPIFVQTLSAILQSEGFVVEYFEDKEVDVDFYLNFASHGYSLVVFRVHSAMYKDDGTRSLCLFTTELHDPNKHSYLELIGYLKKVVYTPYSEGDPIYFGIAPGFVEDYMKGRFKNTIVIMMGCDGLSSTRMAEAFVSKGAGVYVGWSGPVIAEHTDRATIQLLQSLLVENKTIEEAVRKTTEEVGPDPKYNSTLLFHPASAAEDHALPSIATGSTLNIGRAREITLNLNNPSSVDTLYVQMVNCWILPWIRNRRYCDNSSIGKFFFTLWQPNNC